MAACNQTDIPVLNIQEDPCIQGSLITSCIFYGLAIDYLGAQSSSSFFDVLGLIVAKLEAGNIDATNLEEDNRAQALLIEALQNSIAESLVTLSEVQVLLEQCCPEQTTTTTVAPTSTTTTTNSDPYYYYSANLYFCPDCINIVGTGSPVKSLTPLVINSWYTLGTGKYQIIASSAPNYMALTVDAITQMPYCNCPQSTTTTSSNVSSLYFTLGPDGNSACNSMTGATLYWAGLGSPINQRMYQDPALTIPWNDFTYAVNSTNVYNIANGYMSIQGVCSDFTTTTSTTTTLTQSFQYTVSASSTSDPEYICANPYISGQQTLWASTSVPGNVQKFYTDSNLTNPYIGNLNDYYAYMIGWPSGILYRGQMGVDGTMYNKIACQDTTTTTTVATTTTTTTVIPSGTAVSLGIVGQFPSAIVLDDQSNAYVTNVNSHNVTKTTPDGTTTVFGTALNSPYDLVRDSLGNIYTVHLGHNYIRKITPSGVSTIFATAASNLQSITKDSLNNIYALSSVAGTITKVTPDGTVSVFANTGSNPQGIAVDSLDNVYTTNLMSNDITKVTPLGVTTILATFTTAHPRRLDIDSLDNLYISTDEATIKKVTPLGTVTTYNMPSGGLQEVTIDANDNVYVLDQVSKSIYKITPIGTVSTLVTMGGGPNGLATDSNYVYTANSNNGELLKIKI